MDTYNLLNLPQSIAALNTTYTYDAGGQKLRRVIGTTTTDYIGGIEYDNGALTFIQTEEGRALPNGATAYNYEYSLSDHLGDERITFDSHTTTPTIVQQDNYMPFGMDISVGSVVNPQNNYLYNKKELQQNLQLYDYGARFYDPVIARWNTVDPLAEKMRRYSPYNYGFDDPERFTDPDGLAPTDDYKIKQNGSIEVHKTNDKFDTFSVETKSGKTEFIDKFDKNEKGLIQLPSAMTYMSSDPKSSFSFSLKGDNEGRAFISGSAFAALMGAASKANITMGLTVVQFSHDDGSSPWPSISHLNGKNGDLRYLDKNQSGNQILVGSDNLDLNRQSTLNQALNLYGWKTILSERRNDGTLLPFTISAKEHGVKSNHTDHEHLQGFSPNLIFK